MGLPLPRPQDLNPTQGEEGGGASDKLGLGEVNHFEIRKQGKLIFLIQGPFPYYFKTLF